jgi:membrane fusion protein, multidrug efflux system
MKSKKAFFIIAGTFVLMIALVMMKIAGKEQSGLMDTANEKISVSAETATIAQMNGSISYTGSVEGINEAAVISQTSGIVVSANAQVGKRYGAGQVMFVVENNLQSAGVDQASATVITAQVNLEKAKKDFERVERLKGEEAISQDKVELSNLNVRASESQLKGAEAALKVAQKQFSDTYIKSPISGYVASRDVERGALVTPGTKVAYIVDISGFKVNIFVSESDIPRIKVGKKVNITVDALPGELFEGEVASIGMVTGMAARSYKVEVVVKKNKNLDVKSGMFARCNISAESISQALTIPESAVINNNDGTTSVFVIKDGKAKSMKVKIGIRSEGKCELISGLVQGDKVATMGKERLKDGIEVKVN